MGTKREMPRTSSLSSGWVVESEEVRRDVLRTPGGVPTADAHEDALARRAGKTIESAQVDHAACGFGHRTAPAVRAEDLLLDGDARELGAFAVDTHVPGARRQHAHVHAVFVGKLAHHALSGADLAHQKRRQAMRRIADGALEMIDAGAVAELEADGLVKVLGVVGTDGREELLERGVFGFLELAAEVALGGVAVQKHHRARVDLDGGALAHEFVEVLAREGAAHMALGRHTGRGEVADVGRVQIARHLVEPLENFGLCVVRNHVTSAAECQMASIVAKS